MVKQLILFAVTILLSTTSCQPKELPTVMKVTKEQVLLKCSHQTTKDELLKFATITNRLHKLQIDFSETTYLDGGTIQNLKSSIIKGDKLLAKLNADLTSLQYKYYGYEINFARDEIQHLKAGHIE